MEKSHRISNGLVQSVKVTLDRGCFLSVWMTIEHEDGTHQGFGGYVLGGTPEAAAGRHAEQKNLAAEWIVGVMRACDVNDFADCRGKAIRVIRDSDDFGAAIVGIGHIIKNDRWFNAKKAMQKLISN